MSDWLLSMLPHICLGMGGFLVFCAGGFLKERPADLLFGMALAAVFLAGLTVFFFPQGAKNPNKMLDIDAFGAYFYLLLAVITILALLFARQYARHKGFSGDEFYGILLFAALSMFLTAGALHWLAFFLGVEFLSISFYVLIALSTRQPGSSEAALKYFIMGSVAGAFLAFGIAVLYAATGSMVIADSLGPYAVPAQQNLILLGFSLLLVGIGFKLSLVPFHFWTPDVYQGAPAPITAFLSTGAKLCLLAALVRFGTASAEWLWDFITPVLWIIAALTMVWGNIAALTQERLKRLLAYSSMAHMGYLLMALLAIRESGPGPFLFYAAVYGLMDLGVFGSVALLSPVDPETADREDLAAYRGIGFSHPLIGGVLAVSLLSLAGLPPTGGFFGKFVLFRAALSGEFEALAVIGILAAIVSVYVYLKVIVALYFSPRTGGIPVPEPPLPGRAAGIIVMVLLVWMGVFPSPFLEFIGRIAGGF